MHYFVITPWNGPAMVDSARVNPWQSNTKNQRKQQNARGALTQPVAPPGPACQLHGSCWGCPVLADIQLEADDPIKHSVLLLQVGAARPAHALMRQGSCGQSLVICFKRHVSCRHWVSADDTTFSPEIRPGANGRTCIKKRLSSPIKQCSYCCLQHIRL